MSYRQNLILRKLNEKERQWIEKNVAIVELRSRTLLYDNREHTPHVYFPLSASVAITRDLTDGASAQVGIIGNEGVLPYGALIDGRLVSGRAVVQVPGCAARLDGDRLQSWALEQPHFRKLLMHYGHALLSHTMQNIICATHHRVQQRLAVLLLQSDDRVPNGVLPITQDTLADMLGVRRATVGEAQARMRSIGLIRYARGRIEIVDKDGLRNEACECYGVIREEYDRFMEAA